MIPRDDERPHVIDLNVRGRHFEGRAKTSGIYPGMLVEVDSTSADQPRIPPIVKKHATSGGIAHPMIVKENKLIGGLLDDAYAADDVVFLCEPIAGDYTLVRVNDEFTASNGDKLKSNGDGTFILHGGSGTALCQVEDGDSVDYTPDPPASDRHLLARVRWL